MTSTGGIAQHDPLDPGQFEWIGSFREIAESLTPQALCLDSSKTHVLDIGCGTSSAGVQLLRKFGYKSLTAIDCDTTAIDQMHSNFGGVRRLSQDQDESSSSPDHSASSADENILWIDGDINECEKSLPRAEYFGLIFDKGTCDYMLAQHGAVWQLTAHVFRLLAAGGCYVVLSIFPTQLIEKLFQVPGVSVDISTVACQVGEAGNKSDAGTLKATIVRKTAPSAEAGTEAVARLSSGIQSYQSEILNEWFQNKHPLLSAADIARIRAQWSVASAQNSASQCTVEEAYRILIDSELQAEFSVEDFVNDLNRFLAKKTTPTTPVPRDNVRASLSISEDRLDSKRKVAVEKVVWPACSDIETGNDVLQMWFQQSLDFQFLPLVDHEERDAAFDCGFFPFIPQPKNGPCGVLCALQAHVFARLGQRDEGLSSLSCSERMLEIFRAQLPQLSSLVRVARAEALGIMLFQAATVPSYPSLAHLHQAKRRHAAGEGVDLHFVTAMQPKLLNACDSPVHAGARDRINIVTFKNVRSETEALVALRRYFSSPKAEAFHVSAAALVYSLVLSRGEDLVAAELSSPPAVSGGFRAPAAPSLISFHSDHGATGFCEDALLALAALGRPTNSWVEGAWEDRVWPQPPIGLLCGDMHEQPAPFLRQPRRTTGDFNELPDGGVWLALKGGHCTTVLGLSLGHALCREEQSLFFVFVDGLSGQLTIRSACVNPQPVEQTQSSEDKSSTTETVTADPKIEDILAVRALMGRTTTAEREFHCICQADGPLEGGDRSGAETLRWYCRDCWLSSPRKYSYNNADTDICKGCGKNCVECGFSHWLPEAAIPRGLVVAWDREHAPPLLRLLRTRWPQLNFVHERAAGAALSQRLKARDDITSAPARAFTICTFNILAPCNIRPPATETEEQWTTRHSNIINDLLLHTTDVQSTTGGAHVGAAPDVICLQEFWEQNKKFKKFYQTRFEAAGFTGFFLRRPNGKKDGLATFVRSTSKTVPRDTAAVTATAAANHAIRAANAAKEAAKMQLSHGQISRKEFDAIVQSIDSSVAVMEQNEGAVLASTATCNPFEVVQVKNIKFGFSGDRVAILLHLRPVWASREGRTTTKFDVLVVNTHLTVPHNTFDEVMREDQCVVLWDRISDFIKLHDLRGIPVFIGADLNTTLPDPTKDRAFAYLLSQGFTPDIPVGNGECAVVVVRVEQLSSD